LHKTTKKGILRENYLLVDEFQYKSVSDWTIYLESQGRNAFALHSLYAAFPDHSETALKSALNRLVDKGRVVSIHKGYYLVITPGYLSKGILPPGLFMDAFMRELGRPYYMALLSAAAYHGASHQQPQEFFVMTVLPAMRPMEKRGMKVNFISKSLFPDELIETVKTDSGYLKISNPLLTAADLVQFERHVGGLNRAAVVLEELADSIGSESLNEELILHVPVTVLQRLGYLLEKVLDRKELADALFEALERAQATLFRIPLKASCAMKGYGADDRWKVVLNTSIELES
jgi:predicted transcriptional regulator of viral defense system